VPNLLTYARIIAVPVVVACLYWQDILQGGLWLRGSPWSSSSARA
jgi:cardiolipin synthase